MNNTLKILDGSAINFSLRQKLKRKVREFLTLQKRESQALSDLSKAKEEISKIQYSRLMSQTSDGDKMEETFFRQMTNRAIFVNSVFRCHEARLQLSQIGEEINSNLKRLGSNDEPTVVQAKLALAVLIQDLAPVDSILEELDGLPDVDRLGLFKAVQVIFRCKKSGKGLFASRYVTAQMLQCHSFEWWQDCMSEAVEFAIAVRQDMDERWEEFLIAENELKVGCYLDRIEEALESSEKTRAEELRLEQRKVKARLYLAASYYKQGMDLVSKADSKLQASFDKMAGFVDGDDLSFDSVKSMSHILGVWQWLGELRLYILEKYSWHKIPDLLKELDFEPDSYLKS